VLAGQLVSWIVLDQWLTKKRLHQTNDETQRATLTCKSLDSANASASCHTTNTAATLSIRHDASWQRHPWHCSNAHCTQPCMHATRVRFVKFLVPGSDSELLRHHRSQMMTTAALLDGTYSQGRNFSGRCYTAVSNWTLYRHTHSATHNTWFQWLLSMWTWQGWIWRVQAVRPNTTPANLGSPHSTKQGINKQLKMKRNKG